MVLNLFAVLRVGRVLQVVFEILSGALELPQLQPQQTAIAELDEVFRIDHEHHVHDQQTFVDAREPSGKCLLNCSACARGSGDSWPAPADDR